ncbi:MAG: DUF1214 domain-containing protein [Bacteroidota bacterium]
MRKIISIIVVAFIVLSCNNTTTNNKDISETMSKAKEGVKVVSTYAGDLEFQDQTISKKSAEALQRQMDLQRASELVLWSMPITNFYQLYDALQSNLNIEDGDLSIGLFEGFNAVYMFLTANVTTPYTVSMVDLSITGPVVVNIPAGGLFGVADNSWQEPVKEINSGKKETILFVGPNQDYPKDFKGEIVQLKTSMLFYFYRVLGTGAENEKLKRALTVYKLSDAKNPPKTNYIKFSPKQVDKIALNTQPMDMGYWELVNKFVQKEPMADRDRFFYAWLRDFGIEKGKPFKPTAYQKEILLEGLKTGMAMAQVNSFNKRFKDALYQGEDSGWEMVLAGMNPKIDMENYSMYSERASYTYEAVTTSAGMISQKEGQGSAYLGTYYDSDNNALMGDKNYTLRIEPNPPAANFWSITMYDIAKRLPYKNNSLKADISSREKGLIKNEDGSVDLYFGPKAPDGKEANWIESNPGESFFIYLRLYGPLSPYFEQKWKMNKIEVVN